MVSTRPNAFFIQILFVEDLDPNQTVSSLQDYSQVSQL